MGWELASIQCGCRCRGPGIVAHTVSRIVNIRRYGIDIATTYTEIPPE